jgi:hypothetical protein
MTRNHGASVALVLLAIWGVERAWAYSDTYDRRCSAISQATVGGVQPRALAAWCSEKSLMWPVGAHKRMELGHSLGLPDMSNPQVIANLYDRYLYDTFEIQHRK